MFSSIALTNANVATAASGSNPWAWPMLTIALAALGRETEGRAAIACMVPVTPHWTRQFVETFLVTCQSDQSLVTPLLDILRAVWWD